MIGYMLEEALRRELQDREIVVLLTQTLVDPQDPAFDSPTKPIGPYYPEQEETELIDNQGWTLQRTSSGLRRVVASPKPVDLPAIEIIKALVNRGVLVICGGGGGIPVATRPEGGFCGIEAVIDKDLTAALIAERIGAETLIILTNVDGIFADWGSTSQRLIKQTDPEALAALTFETGSMAPKVEAARKFCKATGKPVHIGALSEAQAVAEGRAGTEVRPKI
jgi:carbamate kinase